MSQDGTTAFTVIPINATTQQDINTLTEEVREVVNGGAGLTAEVTGPAALETDLRHAFESADFALLAVTALLVLVLLLAIYRSPLLALIPLVVVGISYMIASGVIKIFADAGMPVTSISTSLLAVLMFGAGTDYCLLLVARYTEELHTHEDRYEALQRAIPRAAPAIIASAGTVILAMLVLIFAELASSTDRRSGQRDRHPDRDGWPASRCCRRSSRSSAGAGSGPASAPSTTPTTCPRRRPRTATRAGRGSAARSRAGRCSRSSRSPRCSSSARSG